MPHLLSGCHFSTLFPSVSRSSSITLRQQVNVLRPWKYAYAVVRLYHMQFERNSPKHATARGGTSKPSNRPPPSKRTKLRARFEHVKTHATCVAWIGRGEANFWNARLLCCRGSCVWVFNAIRTAHRARSASQAASVLSPDRAVLALCRCLLRCVVRLIIMLRQRHRHARRCVIKFTHTKC